MGRAQSEIGVDVLLDLQSDRVEKVWLEGCAALVSEGRMHFDYGRTQYLIQMFFDKVPRSG